MIACMRMITPLSLVFIMMMSMMMMIIEIKPVVVVEVRKVEVLVGVMMMMMIIVVTHAVFTQFVFNLRKLSRQIACFCWHVHKVHKVHFRFEIAYKFVGGVGGDEPENGDGLTKYVDQ